MRISMEFMVEAKQLSAPAAEFHVQQEREPSRLQQRGEARLTDAFDARDMRERRDAQGKSEQQ